MGSAARRRSEGRPFPAIGLGKHDSIFSDSDSDGSKFTNKMPQSQMKSGTDTVLKIMGFAFLEVESVAPAEFAVEAGPPSEC